MKYITRFAPSPTGSPHIGGMRTALFAYLWAKHNKGRFLLRIEDTDRERLVPGAVEEIESAMKWLGLDFDDEIIYQSSRKEIHRKHAQKLVDEGKAYKCYCTKERLSELRATQQTNHIPTGYDKRCRNLSKEEVENLDKTKTPYVIRFAMPETGYAEWEDAVRGKMKVEYAISDDQVLIKSDGWPTYFLAAAVDDNEAGVTDIIRGEEWLPSTPKTIAIYEAFGWTVPRFAHMPVTLGKDGRKKMSKRDGDTAIWDYKSKGYLPEAIINFLVLLGWNPKTT
jgi:glutamyl-tRNA synthetase